MAQLDARSGEGRPEIGDEELRAIADRVRFGRGVDTFRRPDWMGELSRGNADAVAVMKTVVEKVLADPHEETLRAAQLLLNDLSRTDLGPACDEQVTSELMTRLVSQPQKGADR